MAGLKQTIIRGGLESLYFSGAHVALQPLVGGVGAILTLHHVRPPRPDRFQPNRLLEVTPRFLARVVKLLRRSRIDVISLDEMHRRMTDARFRPALRLPDVRRRLSRQSRARLSDPRRRRHAVRGLCADRLPRPARRIVVARARSGDRQAREHRPCDRRREPQIRLPTVAEKRALYDELYWWLRGRESEAELRAIVRDLAARYRVDIAAFCKDLCMSWQEIALLGARSAGDDRRPHRQSSHAGEASGKSRARGNGFEPHGDRGGARRAAGASVLSLRRSWLGRPARICDRRRARISRPR